ncbi:acetylornithine deacetylase/succinyl-diaminopimelate desuccinylase-like protein [Paenibacillus shirakamiensis]|uniref:Acetylornithine deacetylase/succinyl-diaminopimelate desuccinylase-like protein n=2 Tax=Paenibacillus shirakamiensis TaxID=1265935 RepID=A0ABS4JE90_9BACL|nr:acetylornithine deacetylase/succinyl-diaminopimelate desuccinylase-like protein [Paenibacillus shirakamiensis]
MKHLPETPSPAEILQALIRFITTNPPGEEAACIMYIRQLLEDAGIEAQICALDPARPNLLARLKGNSDEAPLLLYGHIDVVGVDKQAWSCDPFGGVMKDGFIWGRGALDMKGGVAMLISSFIRAHRNRLPVRGDVILAIVSDEEAGGEYGASFLVEHYADYFSGVKYALGEFGGFSFHTLGRTFYPIMVAEKQLCWLKATIRGGGGHGSLSTSGVDCMAQLGDLLQSLSRTNLPIRVTPATKLMIDGMADALPILPKLLLKGLLRPPLSGLILKLLGEKGETFTPLLRNTISATVLRGGEKINVHPSEITVDLDGRTLPGVTVQQFIDELRQFVVDESIELEVLRHESCNAVPNMGLFPLLSEVLKEADQQAIPIPMLLPGGTDGRWFARLGIQTYGFLPMQLPKDMAFTQYIHAADERIPVEAVEFGTDAIYRVLERYGA